MKSTAKAPANIAFIKYWGKQDEKLRTPLNSSISMNLSNCYTITTVEFSGKYKRDSFFILNEKTTAKEKEKVFKHLDRVRKKAGINLKAKVISKNSFPKSRGIASSASGFAALTLAAAKAAGLNLKERELSVLARLGSGSACRSIPDGFVEWKKGKSSDNSFAYSLYPANYWEKRDVVVIVQKQEKKVGSTSGMKGVRTSLFCKARLASINKRIKKLKKSFKNKDFKLLGKIIEEETINMHGVMMTQKPALFYWNGETIKIIKAVQEWRRYGLLVYFTIDAGPNVHLICQAEGEKEIAKKVKKLGGVLDVIINKPAKGAHIIKKHLF